MTTRDDELVQGAAREMSTKGGCEFHFSPISMFRAVGILQLAARHPGLDENHRLFIRTFIEHARHFFEDCPSVLEIIRRGDDPAEDRD